MVTNLEKTLVAWLEGRGRRLRAGNDAIPRFLSAQLHCGPNRLDELTALLRNPSERLYVEQTNSGKITLVGLASWQNREEILTDDVPEDLASAWQLIADLYTQVGDLQLAAQEAETALQLASEAEAQRLLIQQELEARQNHQCVTLAAHEDGEQPDELQSLRQKYAALESVVNSGRQALAAKSNELGQTEKQLRAVEAEVKEQKRWFDENQDILQIVKPLIAMRARGGPVQLAIMSN